MGTVTNVIAVVMVTVGIGFLTAAMVGLYRLPDPYSKGHAVSKAEALGLIFVFGGMFFHPAISFDAAVRVVFILGFAVVGGPTAAHALTRATRRAGVRPWIADEEDATAAEHPGGADT